MITNDNHVITMRSTMGSEFIEKILHSIECMDVHSWITKSEKKRILLRIDKQLRKDGMCVVKTGFRQWKVEAKDD